jgi:hypothetical protein
VTMKAWAFPGQSVEADERDWRRVVDAVEAIRVSAVGKRFDAHDGHSRRIRRPSPATCSRSSWMRPLALAPAAQGQLNPVE